MMYDAGVMRLDLVIARTFLVAIARTVCAVLVVASVGACGSTSGSKGSGTAQRGTYKVGAPYKIDGVTYTPKEDFNHVETGVASWYGPGFHGRRTANGERYDMHALTAAHKTLPFGTKVRVRSVHTGKEVVVRINDRGPYKHSRIIDLSLGAISALGLRHRGVTEVVLLRE